MNKTRERYKRLIKMLFAAVMLVGLTAMYAYVWIVFYNGRVLQLPFWRRGNWLMILLYGAILTILLQLYGGFKIGYLKNGSLIYSQVFAVLCTNIITYVQIVAIDKSMVTPSYLLLMTVAEIAFIVTWTLVFAIVYKRLFPRRRMIYIEGDYEDYDLRDKINARDDKYEICEIISYHRGFERVAKKIMQYEAVIIGDIPSHERNLILKFCFAEGIRSYSVPKISDILMRTSDELTLFDSPLYLSRNMGLSAEQEFVKRVEDIVIASIMLVIFSPVFLIASIGIKCTDGGPILFKQKRLTKDGKVFELYKFRTMVVDAEQKTGPVLASEKDPRILPIGRFLRATRMDELPQVFNILKGDMSVVGPRPERPELAEEITKEIPEFPYRLKVKAGLTGYAQVYGKYNTTSYDKLKLDLMYIRRFSIFLDLKLIVMTPKILFVKESTEGVKTKKSYDLPETGGIKNTSAMTKKA